MSKPKRVRVSCGVCLAQITDGKDEALLCEGQCGLWYHRGCGFPSKLYKDLSNSDELFHCLSCTNSSLKEEVAKLKEELNLSMEYRAKYSALANELVSLRKTMDSLSQQVSQLTSKTPGRQNQSYASTVRESLPLVAVSSTAGQANGRGAVSHLPASKKPVSNSASSSTFFRSRIKVLRARKIWETIKTCSPEAVSATISKLVSSSLTLRVRRKNQNTSQQ